jgi:hypothetical protein
MTGWHTALLETYGRSRMDRDHFCLASRRALVTVDDVTVDDAESRA